MCGIAGIFNGSLSNQNLLIEKAHTFLKERGPDAQAHIALSGHTLFHSRLKIIDLTDAANQPFSKHDTHLVFNGEIYNFLKLKQQLIAEGAQFLTNSDTEVLIEGYNYWGIEKLLKQIDGMFAFCLFDNKINKSFLARDRFGKKPLYLYSKDNQLSFSSDIRILASIHKDRLSINYENIHYYLSELSMPQPSTIWKEINQLGPSSYLEFETETGNLSVKKYWELQTSISNLSLVETLEETERLLKLAIQKRTISDVPIGAFLSGGVDSGLIVALLAQQSTKPINTFSVGLEYAPFNELEDARIVADKYDTNHHEIIVSPNIKNDLEGLISYVGEPFADSSLLPSYYICKEIKQKVSVALSGDGGDEGFGGYNDFGMAHRTDKYYGKLRTTPQSALLVAISKISHRLFQKEGDNLGAYREYDRIPEPLKLFRDMGVHPMRQLSLWKDSGLAKKAETSTINYLQSIWTANQRDKQVDTLMQSSLETRLLNDYLTKVDRSSMINSLEVRSPFLDTSLMEFAMKIPHDIKFHGDVNKYLLKRLAQKHVDKNILSRPKRGFGIPIHEWLRKELYEYSREVILDSSFINQLFNREEISKLITEHRSKSASHTHTIWALMCLSLWHKSHCI